MYLTERQRQYLILRHEGKTYSQIGADLNICDGTISRSLGWAARNNGFDSISDLMKATQNAALKKSTKKTRKISGVTKMASGTYGARIAINGKRNKWLGTFRTEQQAITARLEAEKKYRDGTQRTPNIG